MKKITAIKEKVELKDLEIQGDKCKNMPAGDCRYDCCADCYNHTTAYMSVKL
ncbi:hypothetical protein [Paraclostridium sordellii]|uniref:Uncharacterized protein n=1 Tax=Paraclostridium sordellii TaxID=1505 RepID=A0A0C7E983_PARSO|nr:hypothetical protein [Paeniclostridium sordellii]CEN21876.1 Uncharacterised protein [[Clostridium] sordellii] [Paeniclostridium sordellii]CEP41813.1 Uncharacterised protein [[Clostridium] sordellii] [Paeniclostridium sordellii]